MKSYQTLNILPLTVLFLSINRGLIVLLARGRLSTQLFYYGVTTFCISVSLIGMIRKKNQIIGGKMLHRILLINLLVYICWIVIEMLLGGDIESISYFLRMALIPFLIYMFLDIDENVLIRMLLVVSVIVSVSCIIDFVLLNTTIITNGRDYCLASQRLLRQNGKPILHNVASVYRAMGVTGDSYDSGNIMAILAPFWFGMLVTRKSRYLMVFVPVFFISLLMTFSVSNIIAAFVGVAVIIIYKMRYLKPRDILFTVYTCIAGYLIYLVTSHFFNFNWSLLTTWTRKFQKAELESMTALGTSDYFSDIFMFFAGHNRAAIISNVPSVTEFAVLKMAYNSGFFVLMMSLLLMLYPVLCFFKSPKHTRERMLPATIAVGVGVLSLWHYGSVLRSTSIFLFYAMFAIAIKNINCCRLTNDKLHQ